MKKTPTRSLACLVVLGLLWDSLFLGLSSRAEAANRMYWTDSTGKIRRANLDGSSVETLVAGLSSPQGIALQLEGCDCPETPDDCQTANQAQPGSFICGTDGRDNIVGTSGDDTICGYGGRDKLKGEAGNDCIDCGDGRDNCKGNAGNDTIFGGPGNDNIGGGDGNDVINGEEGRDNMSGRAGDDDIDGEADFDLASGGAGTDTCDAELEASCELP
ncbi:MAG: hypothetical protein ACE5JS_21375 [Nitrospinota bacterium]